MYTGSCLCGSIHFTLQGQITDIIHCHCSLCRKASGSAYATNGFIDAQDLHLVNNQNTLAFYESSEGKKKYFCRQCGVPIYSSNAHAPGKYRLRLGTLDSNIIERPISHNFVTSRANWDSFDTELPHYEQHEPGRE